MGVARVRRPARPGLARRVPPTTPAPRLAVAVDGCRARGYSDAEIGAALGITRQAVGQRFGRKRDRSRRTGGIRGGGISRIDWPEVIGRAREIVESYDTSVTLRQLFYRLVSAQVVPNTQGAYKRLSALTAEARRDGDFPPLISTAAGPFTNTRRSPASGTP